MRLRLLRFLATQAAERPREKPASRDLLPPAKPHLLKYLEPLTIALPDGGQAFTIWEFREWSSVTLYPHHSTWTGHYISQCLPFPHQNRSMQECPLLTAGEIAQWLRVPTVCSGNSSLGFYIPLVTQLQGTWCCWPPQTLHLSAHPLPRIKNNIKKCPHLL